MQYSTTLTLLMIIHMAEWPHVVYKSRLKIREHPSCKLIINIFMILTHWGRVMHLCVGKLTTIGWDNGLSPGRLHAIIWTNAGILGTNFNEIFTKFMHFHSKRIWKCLPELVSILSRPQCVNLYPLSSLPHLEMSAPRVDVTNECHTLLHDT